MIKEAIVKIVDKQDLTYDEAYAVISEIMSGETTPTQNAAFLAALSTKSTKAETIEEITGCAAAMRDKATRLTHNLDLLEIVGTGGDGAHSFNISTTTAIVCAAAGVKIAKHGNRAASSDCGTADCLEALGVNINLEPEKCLELLEKVNFCFFFAQKYHTSMKYVGGIRRELGIRTVFNILGPLTNPASPKRQLLGYQSGLYPEGKYVAVKVPVFSFEKLQDVDTMLGPEMKSTGECLGIATNFEDALLKGLVAAGYDLKCEGGVLISVRDTDKQELIPIADKFSRMGFEIYGTEGTASVLNRNMIATNVINKISEPEPNVLTLLESGKIHYVISTSANGRLPARDSVKMRRKAVERSICSVTAIDTAKALANVLETGRQMSDVELVDITKI